jgi:large subunit ribosomal protein L3
MYRKGLIGKKLGITQIFEDGRRIPVTVIQLGPCFVVQKKTPEGKDGYGAIQLGFDDKEHRRTTKAMAGHFKRAGEKIKPKRILREIPVPDGAELAKFDVGQELKADTFAAGDFVDVTGTSKGRGMQGVMKRHNMKGNRQSTHGTHEYRRHTGSVGCRTTPGRIHPGKRMPGHMGSERVTVQNLKIARIDADKNLALVVGAVPGSENGYVLVRQAIKKLSRAANKSA